MRYRVTVLSTSTLAPIGEVDETNGQPAAARTNTRHVDACDAISSANRTRPVHAPAHYADHDHDSAEAAATHAARGTTRNGRRVRVSIRSQRERSVRRTAGAIAAQAIVSCYSLFPGFDVPFAGRYHLAVKAATLFLVFVVPVMADLAAGQRALKSGDYATALSEFLPLANQGDSLAQVALGSMYDAGLGTPQNYKEATRWYRLAAEQGNVNAQGFLAFMYYRGRGVRRTTEKLRSGTDWRDRGFRMSSSSLAASIAKVAGASRRTTRRAFGGIV